MNYVERMEELSDTIIAVALTSKADRLQLLADFDTEIFANENYLIYRIMNNFQDRDIQLNQEFTELFLSRNKHIILNSNRVDKSLFSETDGDIVEEVIASTVEKLEDLQRIDVTEEVIKNIETTKQTYKEIYKTKEIDNIIETMTVILKDGLKVGRTTLFGPDDANDYYVQSMLKVTTITGEEGKDEYTLHEVNALGDNALPTKIGDFGELKTLNTHWGGGLFSSMFYNVMAPTKGGKSKFLFRTSHNIAVVHGNNVLIWPYEGGIKKAFAELRAIHYMYYWETKMGKELGQDTALASNAIYFGNYPTETVKAMEIESKNDLLNNPDYGKIHLIDKSLVEDTYINTLKSKIEKHKIKFVGIDYLQLIQSAARPIASNKAERVGTAYQGTLALIKELDVAFMSPAQMKQESIKELSQGKDTDTRVLGGETSEIVRTPDFNLAFYATPEDIRNGTMEIMGIPSREAEPLPKTQIGINLAYDLFFDMDVI